MFGKSEAKNAFAFLDTDFGFRHPSLRKKRPISWFTPMRSTNFQAGRLSLLTPCQRSQRCSPSSFSYSPLPWVSSAGLRLHAEAGVVSARPPNLRLQRTWPAALCIPSTLLFRVAGHAAEARIR
jgi:hypothetical protein